VIGLLKNLLGLGGQKVAPVSPQDAQARVKSGAVLLDVRSSAERQAVKIPNSKTIPLDQLAQDWETLPKDREIICQCASGMRSAQAANFLVGKGLNASNLSGGIKAWQAAGLPVKRG
jgi:phage shock protein E